MYANMPAIRNSYLDRIPLLLDRFGRGIVIAVVPNEEHALDCFASKVAAKSPMLGDFKKNRSKEGHSNNMGTKILIALCMHLHA